mmetsp:Transcript_9509/g.20664  ORF Transcript_9509/g.20664 Transcript_9509/m.20664 type:complete len:85 (-) Transcript_9509:24-278(-)
MSSLHGRIMCTESDPQHAHHVHKLTSKFRYPTWILKMSTSRKQNDEHHVMCMNFEHNHVNKPCVHIMCKPIMTCNVISLHLFIE